MSRIIRPIRFEPEAFAPMIEEAERSGGRFLLRLRDEWLEGTMCFQEAGEILVGAFIEEELVGVGGISHDPYAPEPGLGRMRHVYVLKRHRGQGIGRELVARLVKHARGRFDALRLTTDAAEAARLYESLGFVRSGGIKETHRMRL